MRRKVIPLVAATLVAATLPLGLSRPANATPALPESAALPVDTSTITLITGDVLTVTTFGDGRLAVTAEPPEGVAPAVINMTTRDGETYVVPDRAGPLLAADRLDPELFNVTHLLADEFDDEHSDAIPLIATYQGGGGVAPRAAAVPAGATRTATLPAIHGAAFEVDKDDASTLWSSLTGRNATSRVAGGGLEKLWLNEPVHATLDQSVPRTGAPDAWADGYDGTGVKVAVLDTGIDPDHPDVAGQIAATENFTTDADAIDHNGHGTHVAATVAGTGTASGGLREGMAPGADLYIGKILDANGNGNIGWTIQGMQWAVDQGVDVVNMSLGGEFATDGTDPLSRALNFLSESSGTLFVVAAGNTGPFEQTVPAPASADLALAVGAVSKSGELAEFSSRGPRIGDDAIKPEITAPGVDIVAARAAGTSAGHPVNDLYTSESGTSMATPHVAGAAAILKQRHPDWGAERLKASLTSTARPADTSVYEQGSGELDVARAVAQPVYANPGTLSFPTLGSNDDPVTRTVTLVNDGAVAVDLEVGLDIHGPDGSPAPDGLFDLPTGTTTVPAGGSVDVPITVNTATADAGRYTGFLTATGAGDLSLSVAVAETKARDRFTLTANVTTRDGQAPGQSSQLKVYNLDTGEYFSEFFGGDPHPSIEVPEGRYSVFAFLADQNPVGYASAYITLLGEPTVEIHQPVTVTLDASDAHRIDIDTPRSAEARVYLLGFYRSKADGSRGTADVYLLDSTVAGLYAVPVDEPELGSMEFFSRWQMTKPELSARLRRGHRHLDLRYTPGSIRLDGHRTFDVVDAGSAEEAGLADVSGKLALIDRDTRPVEQQVRAVIDAGAAAVAIASGNEGGITDFIPGDIPSFTASTADADAIRDELRRHHGQASIRMESTPSDISPYTYDVVEAEDHIPADVSYRVSNREMARVDTVYHSASDDLRGYTTRAMFRPWMGASVDRPQALAGALRQEQWLSTNDTTYRMSVTRSAPVGAELAGGYETYRAGARIEEHWFAPGGPAAPTSVADYNVDGGIPPYREGDTMVITQPTFGDSEPSHWGWAGLGDSTQVVVYRDGAPLGFGSALFNTAIDVDPEPAEYRIEQRANRSVESDGTDLSTISAWTFTSGHTNAREVLPMPHVDYDLGVDIHNTVPARRHHTVEFDVRYYGQTQPMRDADVSVSVSYDEGASWHPERVSESRHGGYQVVLDQPRRDGTTVSLRVRVTDQDGNSLDQTILRAYRVRR